MTLKRCPFCGSDDVKTRARPHVGVCLTCGARGPKAWGPMGAGESWNRRPDLGPDTELEPRTPPGGDRTQKGDNRKGEKDGDSN